MVSATVKNLDTGVEYTAEQVAASQMNQTHPKDWVQCRMGERLLITPSGEHGGKQLVFNCFQWNWNFFGTDKYDAGHANDPIEIQFPKVGDTVDFQPQDTVYSEGTDHPDLKSGINAVILDTDGNQLNGVELQFNVLVYEAA